jgi:hypothetical protein
MYNSNKASKKLLKRTQILADWKKVTKRTQIYRQTRYLPTDNADCRLQNEPKISQEYFLDTISLSPFCEMGTGQRLFVKI